MPRLFRRAENAKPQVSISTSDTNHLTSEANPPSPARTKITARQRVDNLTYRQTIPIQLAVATSLQDAEPQEFPHQAEACQSPAPEPSYPSVDSFEDRQHHQLQRQAEALAQDPSRSVNSSISHPPLFHPTEKPVSIRS